MNSEQSPTWSRPDDLRPASRQLFPYIAGAALVGFAFTGGLLIADDSSKVSSTIVPVPVVAPVHVSVPQVEAPPVTVTPVLAMPAEVETKPAPTYRALTPKLDAECVGIVGAEAPTPKCSWDDGFPAISADGSQIVEAVIPEDGGRGNPGLFIVFTDVAASKVARTIKILDPDEIDSEGDHFGAAKLTAKIARRVTAAQREIDGKQFRSLIALGQSSLVGDTASIPDGMEDQIHAEWAGATMRLVDPATKTEIGRHTFSARDPQPPKKADDGECSGFSLAQVEAWWDPSTRIAIGRMIYHRGGCLCGSETLGQVVKL